MKLTTRIAQKFETAIPTYNAADCETAKIALRSAGLPLDAHVRILSKIEARERLLRSDVFLPSPIVARALTELLADGAEGRTETAWSVAVVTMDARESFTPEHRRACERFALAILAGADAEAESAAVAIVGA